MSKNEEVRFSLPAEEFLERNHVMVYLEDAITRLLEHKDDNTIKVNPFKFFSSYFASVKDGSHVLLREFSFIKATLHNRSSFVRLFWRSFANIARKTELMSMQDYYSLVCLLCPDFPISIVQKTARIILVDDSLDCLISFTDFVYAFQLQLCYDEFLTKCAEVYQVMLQNRSSALETVVVPTSQQRAAHNVSTSGAHGDGNSALGNEGVDSSLFQRTLVVVGDKMNLALPAECFKYVLSTTTRITFYSFLTSLAKSPAVNQHIGKLPPRSELMTTYEPEMTSVMFGQRPPPRPNDLDSSRSTSAHIAACNSSGNVSSARFNNSVFATISCDNSARATSTKATPRVKPAPQSNKTTTTRSALNTVRQKRKTLGSSTDDESGDD